MAMIMLLAFFVFNSASSTVSSEYNLGVGIADVTGPITGITFMGYGNMQQQGTGLHLRQWSRAFIIQQGPNRMVFVNVDCAMMADGVRIEVIERLQNVFGDLYNMDNVMISATHTHSGVGGYLKHILFDLSSFGFSDDAFNAMVSGIVKSIEMAHKKMEKGELRIQKGRVENANVNRSPTSYMENPSSERAKYSDNVDKELTQLQFWSVSGKPMGVINWFAVHATSMNYTNTLVSSDNVGYASILFEQKMNPGNILGKGPFVAAFASANLGDVSPNVMGPICHPSGEECHSDSSCGSFFDSCFAQGPGKDMVESTKIIAERIFDVAWELWRKPKDIIIKGPVKSIHQYVDMPSAEINVQNLETNTSFKAKGCRPAMGYSFAAGTTDGPYATHIIKQGTKDYISLLNFVRNTVLAKPSQEDLDCHSPKPILLFTGGMTYPYDWQPWVVSSQVALVGQIAFLCVPGEFTTMAGRRMRNVVAEAAGKGTIPILAGLCNTYSDYITTYEEYQAQRYEAASTLFGPHTLGIHMTQFQKLTEAIITNKTLERGPEPRGVREKRGSLILPFMPDFPGVGRRFGDVILEPELTVSPGELVTTSFVGGYPSNSLKLDDTYLTVEFETSPGIWKVVATDASWETRFHWRKTLLLFGIATVEFFVPESAELGQYRIRHFGYYRDLSMRIYPYEGMTRTFTVSNSTCESIPWWKVTSPNSVPLINVQIPKGWKDTLKDLLKWFHEVANRL